MVNTNELMLGNYLQFSFEDKISSTKGNKICKVYQIESHSVRIEILKDSIFSILSDNDLEPIPVTEEILEKCGFDKHDISEYVSQNMYSNLQDDKIYEQFDENGESLFSLVGVDRHFRYLHELQNIYFIYRGETLKIEL